MSSHVFDFLSEISVIYTYTLHCCREPFPTWIQLPLEEILRFVGRTLAVQMDMLVCALSLWSFCIPRHQTH